METLADRAHRLALAHPTPALPFPTLARLLREEGCPVTPSALLSALHLEPERFRMLDPWRGPLSALGGTSGAREGTRGAGDRLLVVATHGRAGEGASERLRRDLVVLGRLLDEGSVLERSRWLRLVAEALRLAAVA
jgi:hypothetical protein